MFQLKPISGQGVEDLQKASTKLNDQTHRPFLLAIDGIGLGKHLVSISFRKDYGEYATYMREVKNAASSKMKAYMNLEGIEDFLVLSELQGSLSTHNFLENGRPSSN